MDSLLANYASSDEEEEQQKQQQSSQSKPVSFSSSSSTKAASSLFSSLPQPKSSPLFSSIPQPKQQQQTNKNPVSKTLTSNNFDDHDEEEKESKKPTSNSNKPSSIFSSLPQPKTQTSSQQTLNPLEKTTKRVVQFKPPLPIQSSNFSDDDDEDDEEKERKKRKQAEFFNQSSSVKSFLSSIPAPKSSAALGSGHSSSGSGRRSIIDTEAPASSSVGFGAENEAGTGQDAVNHENYDVGTDQNVDSYANYDQSVENYGNYEAGIDPSYVNYGIDQNVHSGDASSYMNYGGYSSYGDYNGYGDYGQYEAATTTVQEPAMVAESVVRMEGKRGRKEIPTEIVEVKQDELMKNRPSEDKAKLTGIAFGPSYLPVSVKGKPSKLHKRKHQIGSLFFDMKQKEMELAERRAKGLLTKAQTHGKYGW